MSEEEKCEVNVTAEFSSKSSMKKTSRKNKKTLWSMEGMDAKEMNEVNGSTQLEQCNLNSEGDNSNKGKKKEVKSTKQRLEEISIKSEVREHEFEAENSMNEGITNSDGKNKIFENKQIVVKAVVDERVDNEKGNLESYDRKEDQQNIKKKKRLLKEAAKAYMRGICYLSRVPPHMDPLKLRQILSQYGEIQRIYLVPEDSTSKVQRKRAGGFRGQLFSEGWVEFTDKRVAKKVANLLNGEQIGGRKRSSFYFDLWNIKYLSKFKWDDLTEETAYKSAIREQKLALEISAAKRERDFYLSKVDKSRALSSIEERLKKKQKVEEESGMNSEVGVAQKLPKVIRNFPQTQPIAEPVIQNKHKHGLPKNILAGVFGSS